LPSAARIAFQGKRKLLVGLPADAQAVMVFAGLSRHIIFNLTTPALSSEHAKTHASPDADGNYTYRQNVIRHFHPTLIINTMKEALEITTEILDLIKLWESKLEFLPTKTITERRNSQNRTIKQILGHLIDSTSNNIHRIVHLQNQLSPLSFPNYASYGNNDRWIAIQNYQNEDWMNMIKLWKYSNLHLCHVIQNVNDDKLDNQWIA
jgi:hypothetical protein